MSTQTVEVPQEVDPRWRGLSHVASSCCPPYVRTLCGIPIPPDPMHLVDDGFQVDCAWSAPRWSASDGSAKTVV